MRGMFFVLKANSKKECSFCDYKRGKKPEGKAVFAIRTATTEFNICHHHFLELFIEMSKEIRQQTTEKP